jgi:hypothetical protein
MGTPFSLVIPVSSRDEDVLKKTISSIVALPNDDVVFAVDDQATADMIRRHTSSEKVRVVLVPRGDWLFHQAFARREGFRSAKHDHIVTSDIDVRLNLNVLKAVEMLGNGVGVVNLQRNIKGRVWRNFTRRAMRHLKHTAYHTGLYALYRPYWLETENPELAKRVPSPNDYRIMDGKEDWFQWLRLNSGPGTYSEKGSPGYLGEDTILKRAMLKKYKIVSIPEVGGVEVREEIENRPITQRRLAERHIMNKKKASSVVLDAVLYDRWMTLAYYAWWRTVGSKR